MLFQTPIFSRILSYACSRRKLSWKRLKALRNKPSENVLELRCITLTLRYFFCLWYWHLCDDMVSFIHLKRAHLNIHCMSLFTAAPHFNLLIPSSVRKKEKKANWEGEWKSLREHFLDERAVGAFSSFASPMCMAWECYITSFSFQQKKLIVSHLKHDLIYIIMNFHERLAAFASVYAAFYSPALTFSTLFYPPRLFLTISLKLWYFDYFPLALRT